MSTVTTYQHLERHPGSSYKQLFVKGSGFPAIAVYCAHISQEEPMTAEELAVDFSIPLAAVMEAIDYGRSNPPEVAEDIARDDALMEARGQLDPNYKYDPRPKILTPQEVMRIMRS
jgi:hypothetical protein